MSKKTAIPLTVMDLPFKVLAKSNPIGEARFHYRVVDASSERPPLVPATSNRKMGELIISTGRWRGCALFFLALEEGPNCPNTCVQKIHGLCNAVNFQGYRFNLNRALYRNLDRQIGELLELHPQGLAVRLHVTGDFPTRGYIRFWSRMMRKYPGLHLWGHSHLRGHLLNVINRELNAVFPDRCLIRSSDSLDAEFAAIAVPKIDRVQDWDGLVCPATLTATEDGPRVKRKGEPPLSNCAMCGACWNENTPTIIWPLMINGKGPAEYSETWRHMSDPDPAK